MQTTQQRPIADAVPREKAIEIRPKRQFTDAHSHLEMTNRLLGPVKHR